MASYTSLGDQAFKAFNASNYAEAISLYTQALELNPEVPDYYIKRSTAYQRTGNYELALHDAELAVVLAHKRGKREQIGSAQFRRAIALYLQEHYGDAGFCLDAAEKRVSEKEKNMLSIWKKKLEMALQKIDEDDVSREVTVQEIPKVEIPKPKEKVPELEAKEKVPELEAKEEATTTTTATTTAAAVAQSPPSTVAPSPVPTGVVTPANKIRHEWYQTGTHIVLSLFVKGVPKDKAVVEITDKTVGLLHYSFYLPQL
jgi:suppressor of G2 allele of SKP1